MSRTQDLVVARLRLVARRWQDGGGVPSSDSEAVPSWQPVASWDAADQGQGWADLRGAGLDGVDPAGAARVGSDPMGGDPGGEDPVDHDPAGSEPPAADPIATGPAWPPAGMWLRLLGLLVLVVSIGATGFFLSSRPRAQTVDPVVAVAGSAESADPFGDPIVPEPSQAPSVLVHVAGEVRRPGVVRLPAGSRVQDAVEAAGGLRRGTDLGATNLARVVGDGERIEVGGSEPAVAGDGTPAAAGAPLDLNTATADQLDALPGVGPVTAGKILVWRSEHGRFTVVDELAEVPGIGPKTLAELRPLVRV